jgi:hypothetical protein
MNYRIIKLSCGTECIVDEEDFDEINKYTWRLVGAGYVSRNCVYKTETNSKKQRTIYMHKFLKPCPKGKEIDHKNGNKLDNRKENLIICDRQQNCRKRPKLKRTKHKLTSKYKGVSFHQNKWRVRIFVENKEIYLGSFIDEKDAAKAYNEAALTYFKEYAILNDVD